MDKQTNYLIGEDTRRYLDALNAFQEFKNALIHAVFTDYGDEAGIDLYSRHDSLFDSVEGVIWAYMKPHIIEHMQGQTTQDIEI